MAHKPTTIHWDRPGHTEAKHKVLTEYLKAWIPILGQRPEIKDLILIDGFAGPGRYADGEPGSPLLMLDAYAHRADRSRFGVTAHLFFIEEHEGRAAALAGEVARHKAAGDVETHVLPGTYDVEFPRLLSELDERFLSHQRAIFTFIDPFGAEQNKLDLTRQLLNLPRCEALVFIPMTHFARLISNRGLEDTLNHLYGGDSWKEARAVGGIRARNAILVERFREQLKTSCRWVRAFEIVPEGRGDGSFLFFGTNSKLGLRRMKEAMWKLDPIQGQTFRDSTLAGHPVLFGPEVDTGPLLHALRENFGDQPFLIEDALDYTLFETPYLPSHVKKRTLKPLEQSGGLMAVDPRPDRAAGTYPDGTRLRFVARDRKLVAAAA